jgi:hypothetical protein
MTPEEGQILFDSVISGSLKVFFWGLILGAIIRIYKIIDEKID